ncbi:PAS domain-containing protein, partial [Lysobacter sp. D1-1-M9]
MPPRPAEPDLDALTTPLVWADEDGRIADGNQAFARWLGVGVRRLRGTALAALDGDGRFA